MQYTQYMATKWCDLIWYTIICVDMYWLCSLLLIDTIAYTTPSIYDSKDWFEKSWIAILSPCCWPVHHTPFEGKDLVSSLCSGLLTIGPRFGGALDDAAKMSLGDDHRWYLDTRRHWAELGVQWSLQKTDLSILKHELTRLPLRFADAQTSGVAPKDRHKDTLQSIPTTQNYTELRWLIMLKSRQTLNYLKFIMLDLALRLAITRTGLRRWRRATSWSWASDTGSSPWQTPISELGPQVLPRPAVPPWAECRLVSGIRHFSMVLARARSKSSKDLLRRILSQPQCWTTLWQWSFGAA